MRSLTLKKPAEGTESVEAETKIEAPAVVAEVEHEERKEETLTAEEPAEAGEGTEEKNQQPEAIKPLKKKASDKKKKSLLQRLNEIGTVSKREVVEFTRHISVMLGAGVTIFEAIQFLADQTSNKVFKARLEGIINKLNNGQSLSAAMGLYPKIFPPVYVNIVRVGEQAGTLSETMTDLANHLEANEKFRSKVKGALIYPKIIVGVMLTFIFILALFVMPRILTIFKSLGAEIPLATRVMIGITNFINNNLLWIFLVIFLVGTLIYIALKNPKIQKMRDRFYIKVPLVGHIVLNYNTAQVSQHFGTLFASGITIIKCLEITRTVVTNKVFQDEIEHMINKIRSGSSLSQSFPEKSEFPPMFPKMIKVGERTGKLPEVIKYMANYYQDVVDNDVKNITSTIEPVIMVLLGLMVTGLVVTVIGPIYTLISSVGSQ